MSNLTTSVPLIPAQAPPPSQNAILAQPWMVSTGFLILVLVGFGVKSHLYQKQLQKKLKFAELKNRELKKKVQRALKTITKMEQNPDLIHSREFNLDYLRLRMDEPRFHHVIVNQLKVKVKQEISVALRPQQADAGMVGIASKPRAIDQIFDIEYVPKDDPASKRRVLFRVQVRLTKLPTQATSITIDQIIQCLEGFVGPQGEDPTWQPTIQGRIASVHWDQKAKPTPLLVIEQSMEGVNVTIRSRNQLPTSVA